ncbi:MAG: TetR/AcrR family transcriptional regulator [Rhodothermales bacterium]
MPEAEQRIFEAACDVFQEQGYEGARMQEIADRAGINKAMLHYYYRSKDRLFEEVFRLSALKVIPRVLDVVRTDAPIQEKLVGVVHAYVDLLRANPHVPSFVLQELRRNPGRLRQFISRHAQGVFSKLSEEIRDAAARGEMREIEPEHLIANVIGLCVFPFIARPMLQTLTGMDDARFDVFLEERKETVAEFILTATAP